MNPFKTGGGEITRRDLAGGNFIAGDRRPARVGGLHLAADRGRNDRPQQPRKHLLHVSPAVTYRPLSLHSLAKAPLLTRFFSLQPLRLLMNKPSSSISVP